MDTLNECPQGLMFHCAGSWFWGKTPVKYPNTTHIGQVIKPRCISIVFYFLPFWQSLLPCFQRSDYTITTATAAIWWSICVQNATRYCARLCKPAADTGCVNSAQTRFSSSKSCSNLGKHTVYSFNIRPQHAIEAHKMTMISYFWDKIRKLFCEVWWYLC